MNYLYFGLAILLVAYVVFSWIKAEWINDEVSIRRTWYLLFFLGALYFISKDPNSLQADWKMYVSVMVGFILVDSLMILNLYFSKLGGQQMKTSQKQIVETQGFLDETQEKVRNMSLVLNEYVFPLYNGDKQKFVQGLDEFLNEYANLENLSVSVLPYESQEEKELVLSDKKDVKKIERMLELGKTYFYPKDNWFILPLWIGNEQYVAEVRTIKETAVVIDTDATIINTMLLVYTLAVRENNI